MFYNLYIHKGFLKKHAIFAFLLNPIFVFISMTITYRVFHIDTSNGAWSTDPLAPYLLVRLFWIPIFLFPVSCFLWLIQISKKKNKF